MIFKNVHQFSDAYQTGSQELNRDSQTPLSPLTSSSLLEDTYILPKQPRDFICHHVLGLLGSPPASALIVSVFSRDKRELCQEGHPA